jgi:hypothetical protein
MRSAINSGVGRGSASYRKQRRSKGETFARLRRLPLQQQAGGTVHRPAAERHRHAGRSDKEDRRRSYRARDACSDRHWRARRASPYPTNDLKLKPPAHPHAADVRERVSARRSSGPCRPEGTRASDSVAAATGLSAHLEHSGSTVAAFCQRSATSSDFSARCRRADRSQWGLGHESRPVERLKCTRQGIFLPRAAPAHGRCWRRFGAS